MREGKSLSGDGGNCTSTFSGGEKLIPGQTKTWLALFIATASLGGREIEVRTLPDGA